MGRGIYQLRLVPLVQPRCQLAIPPNFQVYIPNIVCGRAWGRVRGGSTFQNTGLCTKTEVFFGRIKTFQVESKLKPV